MTYWHEGQSHAGPVRILDHNMNGTVRVQTLSLVKWRQGETVDSVLSDGSKWELNARPENLSTIASLGPVQA